MHDQDEAPASHAGPYSQLEVPSSMEQPGKAFTEKWIEPFYRSGMKQPDTFAERYAPLRHDVSSDLISRLLVCFNWRTRLVGAYFAAIEDTRELTEHLGRLLLRSDLCYAGRGYALALARFATEEATAFLKLYLDHYLKRKDLSFDQGSVMAALGFLDRVQGSDLMEDYRLLWEDFIGDEPRWSLEDRITDFARQMKALEQIAASPRLRE